MRKKERRSKENGGKKMTKCRKCGVELSLDNWFPSRQRKRDLICKECSLEQQRKWRKENPERFREVHQVNQRYYYKRHRDFLNKFHSATYYSRRYNLPIPSYKEEDWKRKRVKVARYPNGKFVTWKKV